MTKLKKVWKSKWKILEGLWYNHVVFFFNKKHWAFKQVKERRATCATCVHLDAKGEGPEVFIKGEPACSFCGCNIKELTACLSCHCSYDESPLWEAINIKDDYKIESEIMIKDRQDDQVHRR